MTVYGVLQERYARDIEMDYRSGKMEYITGILIGEIKRNKLIIKGKVKIQERLQM
jgi:hypothetical protein